MSENAGVKVSSPPPHLSLAEYWALRKSKTPRTVRPGVSSKRTTIRTPPNSKTWTSDSSALNTCRKERPPHHRKTHTIKRTTNVDDAPKSGARDVVSFVKHRLRASTYGNYVLSSYEKLQKLIQRWRHSQGEGDDIYVEDFVAGIRRHCKIHPDEVWRVVCAVGGVDDRRNVSIESIINFVQGGPDHSAETSFRESANDAIAEAKGSAGGIGSARPDTGDADAFVFEEDEGVEDLSYEDVVSDLTRAIRRAEKFNRRTRGQSNREPLLRLIAAAQVTAFELDKHTPGSE